MLKYIKNKTQGLSRFLVLALLTSSAFAQDASSSTDDTFTPPELGFSITGVIDWFSSNLGTIITGILGIILMVILAFKLIKYLRKA